MVFFERELNFFSESLINYHSPAKYSDAFILLLTNIILMFFGKLLLSFIFLFVLVIGYSQTDSTNTLFKDCTDSIPTNYTEIVLGGDTLNFFISSKYQTHITFGNITCYTADVICPELEMNRKDDKTKRLAMYLIYHYDLNEVRIFKTCKAQSLARMSIRPLDPEEQKKIEQYIRKNLREYKRSITLN